MTLWEQQQAEIDTITGRSFTLELSDADVLRLCKKAGGVGMTAEELLKSFVGDLIDGTYSNGSDERMYAGEWFDRCGFDSVAEETLLRYLIETDGTDDFLRCAQNVANVKGEMQRQESELANLLSLPRKNNIVLERIADLKEEIENLQDDIAYDQERLDDTWADFAAWCEDTPHSTLAEETAQVVAWQQGYKSLAGPVSDVQPQQRENDFIVTAEPLAP